MADVSPSFEQSAVSRAVWPWVTDRPATGTPATTTMRAGIVRGVATAGISAIFAFGLHYYHMAVAVSVVGLIMLLAGAFSPPAFRAIERALGVFARWVGVALGWIFLAPLFYLCFAPAHLVLTLRGKDPMHRDLSPDYKTYWTPHTAHRREGYYKKQY